MGDEDSARRIKEYIEEFDKNILFSLGSVLYYDGHHAISLELLSKSAELGCKDAQALIDEHNRQINMPKTESKQKYRPTIPQKIVSPRNPRRGLDPKDWEWQYGSAFER